MNPTLLSAMCCVSLLLPAAQAQDRPILSDPYRAGRTMSIAEHGMVASSHVLASQAGVEVLRAGGSAADAVVAMAATLGVVEPAMTGIGGDAFVLYYEAATGTVHAYNGSGRAPRGLSREHFAGKDKPRIETTSWESITVPGAVDAYAALVARFGKRSLAEDLAPAIHFAEAGFPVAEYVGEVWKTQEGKLRRTPETAALFLADGKAPAVGRLFKFPKLAASLRKIAAGGADAFYRGAIAEEIVAFSKKTGGFFTLEDFADHQGEWVEPIHTNYRGYEVYQCPPNGQGLAVLLMLNMLEPVDFKAFPYNGPEYLHLLVETKKLAFEDLGRSVADPAVNTAPLDELLSKSYAAGRAAQIDPRSARMPDETGLPTGGDTIYCTAVDREGNAASFINSLFGPFGSGIVGGDTGIMLQNRGEGFNLLPGHINEYAPGKRPFHTIIPGMVLKDGALYLSYGLMGGDMQPQGHVHFLVGHLDYGLSLQEAIDAPRWRHMDGKTVRLERGTPESTVEALSALGHDVRPGIYLLYGGAQAILRHPQFGTLFGGSDSRKDGAALGF